jgi:hypothetical protein
VTRLILGVLALVLAHEYVVRIDLPQLEPRQALHNEILTGTAPSPYRYRVLVPYTAAALMHLRPQGHGFFAAYMVLDLATIAFFLWALYRYLALWVTARTALLSVALIAATVTLGIRDHYFQPWSFLEAGLMAAGLYAAAAQRWPLLVLVIVAAALNRETALFIVVAAAMLAWPHGRRWFAACVAVWSLAYFGVRWWLGPAPYVETLWETNLVPRNLLRTALLTTLTLGLPIVLLTWGGYKASPACLRRPLLVVPLFLVPFALYAVWWEVRLWMTMFPVLWPLAAVALEQHGGGNGA